MIGFLVLGHFGFQLSEIEEGLAVEFLLSNPYHWDLSFFCFLFSLTSPAHSRYSVKWQLHQILTYYEPDILSAGIQWKLQSSRNCETGIKMKLGKSSMKIYIAIIFFSTGIIKSDIYNPFFIYELNIGSNLCFNFK